MDWSADVHGTEVIARDPAWWTILHILQLPLFELLGVTVLALTWGREGRAVWASRRGVAALLFGVGIVEFLPRRAWRQGGYASEPTL